MKSLPITIKVYEEAEYIIVECEEYNICVQGRNLTIALERFGKTWEGFQLIEVST